MATLSGTEAAHPLVATLLLGCVPGDRVVVLGAGSGRNLPPLLDGGLAVDVLDADAARHAAIAARFPDALATGRLRALATTEELGSGYAAVLSTHALLHGTPDDVARLLAAAAAALSHGGGLYVTFGSRSDPRFGAGRRIDEGTWAPLDGSEAGVAHAFFDRAGLIRLCCDFDIDEATEAPASETAGAWAHEPAEAARLRHWFVMGRRRGRP